jgi:hypothetical protein
MIRFQHQASARPRAEKTAHRFTVGQLVRMKGRSAMLQSAPELFQVKNTLPVKDGSPQYRIRSDQENYDRVTTEDNLEEVVAGVA